MAYHESRSTSIDEQILVANVATNRAVQQNRNVCSVVFDKRQFNWSANFKQKSKFKNYQEMLSYYKIDDSSSWVNAVSVAINTPQKTKAMYYHDNSGSFKFKNKLVITKRTKNFTFYKDKEA